MIPKRCALDEQERVGKPVSMYWAWNLADGSRRAYKQLICEDCFRERYVPLIVRAFEPLLACPWCGEDTTDGYDAVYVTYCPPGAPKGQSEMPLCGVHAAELRGLAMHGATPLQDRGVGVGGQGLSPRPRDSASDWAAMGLYPAS